MQMGAQVLAWDRLYKNKKGTTNYNSPLTEYKCLQQACRILKQDTIPKFSTNLQRTNTHLDVHAKFL
jgi:hypothetical protein